MTEYVDILQPPTFEKTGQTKPLEQAWEDENWLGAFNLWIVQDSPIPAIVYQQRNPKMNFYPGLLDVTAGGHYSAGEQVQDGLREVVEELGKNYHYEDLTFLGRKLNVAPDTKGRTRHNIIDIFIVKDNSVLSSYTLQKSEVYALCAIPLDQLVKVHQDPTFEFEVAGLNNAKKEITIAVSQKSFPYNWDHYHYKIALLAKRFLRGEPNLIY